MKLLVSMWRRAALAALVVSMAGLVTPSAQAGVTSFEGHFDNDDALFTTPIDLLGGELLR
ncbi:MAG: hypothetical protein HY021_12200, partial [Burkholderiales bacterium]|nr:hypothetical protein [Burkholderiales bacterium]